MTKLEQLKEVILEDFGRYEAKWQSNDWESGAFEEVHEAIVRTLDVVLDMSSLTGMEFTEDTSVFSQESIHRIILEFAELWDDVPDEEKEGLPSVEMVKHRLLMIFNLFQGEPDERELSLFTDAVTLHALNNLRVALTNRLEVWCDEQYGHGEILDEVLDEFLFEAERLCGYLSFLGSCSKELPLYVFDELDEDSIEDFFGEFQDIWEFLDYEVIEDLPDPIELERRIFELCEILREDEMEEGPIEEYTRYTKEYADAYGYGG